MRIAHTDGTDRPQPHDPICSSHRAPPAASVNSVVRAMLIMYVRCESVLGHICNSLTCGYPFPVMGQVRNVAGHSHGGASPSRTCPYVHAERRHSGRQASDRCPYRFAGTQNSRGRHGILRPLEGQPWLRTGPGSAALHLVHHDQYRAALHRCLPVAEDGEKHPQH